jgi:hypothetical protein
VQGGTGSVAHLLTVSGFEIAGDLKRASTSVAIDKSVLQRKALFRFGFPNRLDRAAGCDTVMAGVWGNFREEASP